MLDSPARGLIWGSSGCDIPTIYDDISVDCLLSIDSGSLKHLFYCRFLLTVTASVLLTAAAKMEILHSTIKALISNLTNIHDETGEYKLKLPDNRIIDTKSWHGWEWTHGIGLYGLWKYYELTSDETLLDTIEAWFTARINEGGTTKNINTMAVFLALANVYDHSNRLPNQSQTPRGKGYKPYLESWSDWAMHDLPRTKHGGLQHITYIESNDQQLWDDTLMMTVLPLARIGQILNRTDYIEEAKRQFLLHVTYLFDRRSGLFFHGWTFDGMHNFADARWARGNSWVTMAIPEFIDMLDLPAGDPVREYLLEVLLAQCEALRGLQDRDTGSWRTLLDHPDSYIEASATAGFAYGILKAVRKRYIPVEFKEVGDRAIEAILDSVGDTGELMNTSFGTPMGHDLDFYKKIPLTAMPYGQAMAIMALGEALRQFL